MKAKTNIKTIVVGVDFSKYATRVVKQARALSKHINAPIVFVHVFEDPLVAEWKDAVVKVSLEKEYSKEVKTRYHVKEKETVISKCGSAFEEIIKAAAKFPSPMILVGDRGIRGPVSRFFLGSTAERLALNSPYPVLVHKGNKIVLPKKILIPCDFSARSENAIDGVKKLKITGAKVELYHVRPFPVPTLDYQSWHSINDELEKLNARELRKFKEKYASLKVVDVKSADIADTIDRHSKAFDLIVISPRKDKGIVANFGSVTSKVVRKAETSVLVIP